MAKERCNAGKDGYNKLVMLASKYKYDKKGYREGMVATCGKGCSDQPWGNCEWHDDIENKNNRTIHQVVDDYNRVSRSTKLAFSGTMSTSVYVDNAKFIEGFPIVPRNMVLLEYEHPTIHGKPFLYLSRNGWNARGEWVSEIEYASAFLSGYYIVHEYNKELRSIYEDAMIMEHMYGKPIKVKWAVLERQPIILKVEEHEA